MSRWSMALGPWAGVLQKMTRVKHSPALWPPGPSRGGRFALGSSGKGANGIWKQHFLGSGNTSEQNGSRAWCHDDGGTSPVIRNNYSGPWLSPCSGPPSSLASPM